MADKTQTTSNETKASPLRVPDHQIEPSYQTACRTADGAECTVFYKDRAHFYRQAQQLFLALGDYKDSIEQAERCAQAAAEAETDGCEAAFQSALAQVNTAETPDDYYTAARSLARITDHPDAQRESDACMKKYEKLLHRHRPLKLALCLILCVVIACGVAVSQVPGAKYFVGCQLMAHEDYAAALDWLLQAREFSDAEERITVCRYQRGLALQNEGKYERAYDKFRLTPGYEDADQRLTDCVHEMLSGLQPGDTASFGAPDGDTDNDWYVTANDGNTITLFADFDLRADYQTDATPVTWADCSLRSWLNTEFLSDSFTEAETTLIAVSELNNDPNLIYGTDGGAATGDQVYLFSEAEVHQYADVLFHTDEDGDVIAGTFSQGGIGWRLRTPGASADGSVYVDSDGTIVTYGFVNSSERVHIRPVIQVSLS